MSKKKRDQTRVIASPSQSAHPLCSHLSVVTTAALKVLLCCAVLCVCPPATLSAVVRFDFTFGDGSHAIAACSREREREKEGEQHVQNSVPVNNNNSSSIRRASLSPTYRRENVMSSVLLCV